MEVPGFLINVGGKANIAGFELKCLGLNIAFAELINGDVKIPDGGGILCVYQVNVAAFIVSH